MTSGTAKRTTSPLIELLMQHRSPGAIAGGLAFGTMLGLMPKDSLLALCILSLIAILPVNQLIACSITISLTLLESMTWGITDWIGFHTLSLGAVSSLIGTLYQIPIAPWLRLENTVVMGALMLGIMLWAPCFVLTYRISSRLQRSIVADEVTALAAAALRHQSFSGTDKCSVSDRAIMSLHNDGIEPAEASQLTVIVPDKPLSVAGSQPVPVSDDLEERILRETLIEVIRFKRPAPQQTGNDSVDPIISSSENQPMHLTNFIRKDSAESNSSKPTLPGHISALPVAVNMTQLHTQPHSKEDSLRNILKHIHTARESKREVERSS
jgi:uncharacterized protein (TIGR03546 family)